MGLWLKSDRQQLARRLSEVSSQAARVSQLEEEHRQLQAQSDDLKRAYESQLAELKANTVHLSILMQFRNTIFLEETGWRGRRA